MANLPWVPGVYQPNSTIAELILRGGQDQANRQERMGQQLAGSIQDIGGALSQGLQQRKAEQEKKKQETMQFEQDRAFVTRMADQSKPITLQDTIGIYGPQKGLVVHKAYEALQGPKPDLKIVLAGFEAVGPLGRAAGWPAARQHLIEAGAQGDMLPPPDKFDEDWYGRFKVAALGEQKPKLEKGGPGDVFFDPAHPEQGAKFSVPAAEKPDTRSLEARLAALPPGSPEAKQILNTMRQQAEATRAPREPKEDKLYPVDTVDADGNPIKTFVTESRAREMAAGGPGMVKPKTAMVQNREAAAKSSITAGEGLLAKLQDPNVVKNLGPIIGRYNSLAAAAGAGDPTAQELVGAIKSFSALQPQIHGFRAFQMGQDIEHLLTTKQTPEALAAALRGILTASYIVSGREPGGDKPVKVLSIKKESE